MICGKFTTGLGVAKGEILAKSGLPSHACHDRHEPARAGWHMRSRLHTTRCDLAGLHHCRPAAYHPHDRRGRNRFPKAQAVRIIGSHDQPRAEIRGENLD